MGLDPDDTALFGHLNLIEVSREFTRWGVGGAIEESDGVVLFATGSWLPVMCNGAFRADEGAAAAEVVARADTFFGARRRGYTVMVRDLPVDADLRAGCEAAGLDAFGDPAPEMVCSVPVAENHPDGIDIRRVTTESGVVDFAAVCSAAYSTYGMPVEAPVQLFGIPHRMVKARHVIAVVAYADDTPVAAAMSLLSHGIAGLYWVGTVQEARRSGLGRAVTAAVTNASFDHGAAAVTLQASVMGEPIYRAMGYHTLYHYQNWVRFMAPGT
ncbi:MAG TPA: GNAT family N-acetyltransferase [Acidimicrobiales bacterium]